MLMSLDDNIKANTKLPFLVALLVMLVCITISFFIWQLSKNQENKLVKKASLARAQFIEHQLSKSMPTALNALARMKNRWSTRQSTPFAEWHVDAQNYVKDTPGLTSLQWVDSGFIIRWIVPLKGNEKAFNLDLIFEPKRKAALEQAKQLREFTLTKVLNLTQEGDKGFFANLPLYVNKKHDGFIVGAFSVEPLIESLLPDAFHQNYNISVFSGKNLIYKSKQIEHAFNKDVGAQHTFSFYNEPWTLKVWPKPTQLAQDLSNVPTITLANSLIISLLIGITTLLALSFALLKKHLIASEIEHRATINNAIDGIITINKAGIIRSLNLSAQAIFQYKETEVIGKNIKCLMPEPYHHEHDGYLSNYINTKQKKIIGIGRTVQGKRKSGEVFPMELGVSEFNASGQTYFCGVIRDITMQTALEKDKEKLIEELSKSNQELDNFAYIASHDLKEPLRAIQNHSTFLLEDYGDIVDEDGKNKLNRLLYLSGRMEKLISDLLYFSRLGTQQQKKHLVDVHAIIKDVTNTLQEAFEQHNVRFICSSRLPHIVCDETHVTELFYNLITNAYKYNQSAIKTIEIGFDNLTPPRFFIKDNGIGIDKKFKHSVFRIFKRLNNPKKFGEGTGAGLTFAKKIVEQHKGKIWFESELNQGTCFYFTLGEQNDSEQQQTTHSSRRR